MKPDNKPEDLIAQLRKYPAQLIAAYTLDPAFAKACHAAADFIEAALHNPPLTLEELREMDGQAVYLDFGGIGENVLVCVLQGDVSLRHKNGILSPIKFALECFGQIYRRKPEEGTV